MSLLEAPMRPGEVLQELYLAPLDMGAIALARRLGVPRTRIERLVKEALNESILDSSERAAVKMRFSRLG